MSVTQVGQVNQQGDERALFLKEFKGDLLDSFTDAIIMDDKCIKRTLDSGKSLQVLKSGLVTVGFKTPGQDINVNKFSTNEVQISIDGLIYAAVEIEDLDRKMSQADYFGDAQRQMGSDLAAVNDVNTISEVIKGARSFGDLDYSGAATPVFDNPGYQLVNSNFASLTATTKGDALLDGLLDAAAKLDNNHIPSANRFAMFGPDDYYALFKGTTKDLVNTNLGANGSLAKGIVAEYAGFKIVKSANLVRGTNSTVLPNYAGNATHGVNSSYTYGICWIPDAIYTVRLMDLDLRTFDMPLGVSTIIRATQASGHGFVRPEGCIELVSQK
jgi:hypothetical protein